MFMRKFTLGLATVLGLLSASDAQAAIRLNFAASPGSFFQVVGDGSGGTVSIQPNSDPQFVVTTVNGGDGTIFGSSGVGATGSIVFASPATGFTFEQGDIVSSGGTESAPLSGTGTLTLKENGTTAVFSISGGQISTTGAGGGVNTTSTSINISATSISGAGLNNDLTTFFNQVLLGAGIGTISFQFDTATSLTQLSAVGTATTSFSGTLTSAAVPEPATVAMLATALPILGLGYLRRRRAQA